LFIEKVEVENALPPRLGDEAWPVLAVFEGKRTTGFHGAEDADEAAVEALLADDVLGPLVFAELIGAKLISAFKLAGPALGVLDERIGKLGRPDFHEVAASHAQEVIDKAFELGQSRERQMPFEQDAIETV